MSLREALPPRVSLPWLGVAVALYLAAFAYSSHQTARPIEPGDFSGYVDLTTDVYSGSWGGWALGETEEGLFLVEFESDPGVIRGDRVHLSGRIDGDPGTASGRSYRATIEVARVDSVDSGSNLAGRIGGAIRKAVIDRLEPFDGSRALLAGFLIGDVSRIARSDVDAMRKSGLAHFVAVSGSNVALFLAILFVVSGPLAMGTRRRAVIGLLGLPIYAAATRFEPSVMRASVMAAIALGGRLFGIVLESWQLLSLAVVVLVLWDPVLTTNVGFQLSVAATAGVLVGARVPAANVIVRAALITIGAQLAVAPLSMAHFGSVPLLSPVVNLVAAPLVSFSTIVGVIGVGGLAPLITPAARAAGLVMQLARGSAGWPQLGPWQLAGVVGAGCLAWLLPRARPLLAPISVILLVVGLTIPGGHLEAGEVVVLDVGQGDSILLDGGHGSYALVDGGPDPDVIIDKLRHYGVTALDLMVLTHVHADHATGLAAVVDHLTVRQLWIDVDPHRTPASEYLLERAKAHRIPTSAPGVGTRLRLGDLELVVEGPVRRYASPNDQSIVIRVVGPGRTMLLTGDIETFAQADLADLHADVLKVPHQGGATSDPGWLENVGADLAVIPVGPNRYGHPAAWVVDLLERAGELRRTDVDGDVVVDLFEPP